MANRTIQFEIVTPERTVLKQDVLQVTLPTSSGEITILPGHIPLISVLQAGVVEVKRPDNSFEVMSVSAGFIEVSRDKVVILADTAERADELDEKAVEEMRRRAEELKKEARSEEAVEFTEISAKLSRELARLKAINRWRKIKGDKPSTNN